MGSSPVETTEAALDAAALDAWIGTRLPGSEKPLQVSRLGTELGVANALYLLTRGTHRWVLRQPPEVKSHPTASDTTREWRFLHALEGTDVAHPQPLLYCDGDVLGRPCLIMAHVDGFTPALELPEPFLADPHLRHDLGLCYVDGCAALSKVDWVAAGLSDMGKPAGFLDRQIPRWMSQLDSYASRPLPALDFVVKWLEANRPSMSPPAILHGDYSPFNVMVAPRPPTRLAAIVDWDTATIGDPLLDLGHLLARWPNPDEEPVLHPLAGNRAGYPTRAELAARYATITGRDLSALRYYEVLALFKLAVILEGIYARDRNSGVPDSENPMFHMVLRCLAGAAEFATDVRS